MRIQTNVPAMYAYNRYRRTNKDTAKTLEKLSSGLRINRASDDASGLAISEKMRCKITELDRCRQNVAEGVNIVKTADAALKQMAKATCSGYYNPPIENIIGEVTLDPDTKAVTLVSRPGEYITTCP